MSSAQQPEVPVVWVEGREATAPGNYFVANYPPFSFWRPEAVERALGRLGRPPVGGTPLGLYIHVPFCRKRCDFCYFKVYTDKNAHAVRRYLEAVLAELDLYLELPFVRGRRPLFVYFGGGTPSYLSTEQLRHLFAGLAARVDLSAAQEVTFECEPGTLQEEKVHALRALGVTRLSIGVESFDADVLAWNNRAHRGREIFRAWDYARAAGFPQVNLDLIAGMVGETDEIWRAGLERVRDMAPESLTIYQMEVPYNTRIYQRMRDRGAQAAPVADWETKRRRVSEAFDALVEDGYRISSAYTLARDATVRFLYRDGLWHGSDMLGLGVASFSFADGVHFQNEHDFDTYLERVERGELPLFRAHEASPDERLVREFVLQLKLGETDTAPLSAKFGVNVLERFEEPLREQARAGMLEVEGERIRLTRAGLLRVDLLLRDYFRREHRGRRYA